MSPRPGSLGCARLYMELCFTGHEILGSVFPLSVFNCVVFGIACCGPSAIISVSFPYKSWALSAEMPKNLSLKSSAFL